MPQFTLNLTFTQGDLTHLRTSGMNLVVAKPNAGEKPNLAWLVFLPLLENIIAWEEAYGIYASTTNIQNRAAIVPIIRSDFPAAEALIYPLLPSGEFGPAEEGGTVGSYMAANQYDELPVLTFGLFQNAIVNGNNVTGNAVSADSVPYQFTDTMTPATTVYLWLQSQVTSNTLLGTVTSPITEVDFGESVTSVSLQYNATTGKFVPVGSETI